MPVLKSEPSVLFHIWIHCAVMGDIEMADYVNSQDLEDERKRQGVKKRYGTGKTAN